MSQITVRNVNDAYEQGIRLVMREGTSGPSRNGEVVAMQEPVLIEYLNPRERVLFDPNRDANPFFHFMEAIWMLAGSREAAWPVKFNRQMEAYANADGYYDGAYGFRWRHHFCFDQIVYVAGMLRNDPYTRRAVIGMYDPRFEDDDSKDIPCNTQIFFRIVDYKLDMTVTNRSNDAVWGAFGANAVHFSMLQEVMAAMIGREVGHYFQFTNNLHIYTGIPKVRDSIMRLEYQNYYMTKEVEPFALVSNPGTFLKDCENFIDNPFIVDNTNPLFYYVARPMYMAWMAYKEGDIGKAIAWCTDIEATDWRRACIEWLKRRQK